MAVVGAVARAALPPAEAGTPGVLLEEQLAPQSWLRPGERIVVLLWRMWLVGSSVLCPMPASPEGKGVQPGEAARALAQGREEQSWANSTPTPGHTWVQVARSILSLPAMWVALVPQPGSGSPPVMPKGCLCVLVSL